MCCCRLTSCCCGLHALGPGLQQLAILSLLVNLSILLFPHLALPLVSEHGYQGWLVVLMASDVGLALGARSSTRLLLLPWLITYAIHILVTCVLAPLVVVGAVTVVKHIRGNDIFEATHNTTKEQVSSLLPEDRDLRAEVEDAMEEVANYDFASLTEEQIREVITMSALVILPLFYVYTWVAAHSHYQALTSAEVQTAPGQRRVQGRRAWAERRPGGVEGPHPVPWYVSGLMHEREVAMAREQGMAMARQQGGLPHPWYEEPRPGASSTRSSDVHRY